MPRSLGQLAQRVAIANPALLEDLHGLVEIRVEGRQKDAVLRLDDEHLVTGLNVKLLGHLLRQGCRDRAASLPERNFLDHGSPPYATSCSTHQDRSQRTRQCRTIAWDGGCLQ